MPRWTRRWSRSCSPATWSICKAVDALAALAAVLANQYPCRSDDEFWAVWSEINAIVRGPNWLTVYDGDTLAGFVSWLCVDDEGAALIREFGFNCVVQLALPLHKGPHVVVMHTVVMPGYSRSVLGQLWRNVHEENAGKATVQTRVFSKRSAKSHWIIRKIRGNYGRV